MKIRSDGVWLYQGSPIGRMPLVKLFAGVLRKDADGKHYLVTPAEKVDVAVDGRAVPGRRDGGARAAGASRRLVFRTNVDDIVTAGPEHPLRFAVEPASEGLKPYLLVRGRLEALVTRALYYDLVELAVRRGRRLRPVERRRILRHAGAAIGIGRHGRAACLVIVVGCVGRHRLQPASLLSLAIWAWHARRLRVQRGMRLRPASGYLVLFAVPLTGTPGDRADAGRRRVRGMRRASATLGYYAAARRSLAASLRSVVHVAARDAGAAASARPACPACRDIRGRAQARRCHLDGRGHGRYWSADRLLGARRSPRRRYARD